MVVSNLVNTMYCRDAGKKLRTANQVKWRKGITTASAAPFGYQFDPDKKGAFIIDPPAAKIVRRIFDLAILGLGTRDIAMMVKPQNLQIVYHFGALHKEFSHRIYCAMFIIEDVGALVRESGAIFPTRWG